MKEGSENPDSFRMREQRTSSIVVQPINSLCYTRPQVFDDFQYEYTAPPLLQPVRREETWAQPYSSNALIE